MSTEHLRRPLAVLLAGAGALAITAALVDCSGETATSDDAGVDAPFVPTDTGTDQQASDTGPSVDSSPDTAKPACDPMKNFAAPAAVTLQNNASPLVVRGFKVRGGIAYLHPQASNKVQQGAYGAHVVSTPTDAYTPITIAGFDVSADGLALTFSTGLGVVRSTRASTGAAFGVPAALSIPMPMLDASTQLYEHLAGTASPLQFTRVENSTGPFTVDIFSATANPDGGPSFVAVNETTLHSGIAYVARPVPRSDTRLYLTGWAGTAPAYQRLHVATRASASMPWGAPVAVTIDGLTPQAGDQVVPLDVSTDDCTVWYGVGTSVDGPYSVYEARRPL